MKDEVNGPGQGRSFHSFVGQVYRGMQSLCAGYAEGRQLPVEVEGEKSSAG